MKRIKAQFILFCIIGILLCSCVDNRETENIGTMQIAKTDLSAAVQEESRQTSDDGRISADRNYYQQLLLYIQQGLRIYDIEGSFTVSFRTPDREKCRQELVLSNEAESWYEFIYYQYDQQKEWYTFYSTYEPIFYHDQWMSESENSELRNDVLSEIEFAAEISADMTIDSEVRFNAPAGPITYERQIMEGYKGSSLSDLKKYQYLYIDERIGVDVNISYPQMINFRDMENNQAAGINELIRAAFFYGYHPQWDVLELSQLHLIQVDRNYRITRYDDTCFSMRIYEYNDYYYANHPNEWETALTIDLVSGERMVLDDVIRMYLGEDITLKELLETGTFDCLWIWHDGAGEDDEELGQQWIQRVIDFTDIDVEKEFYLTENGIGLITGEGRYYVCMEADFDELKAALR